MKQETINVKIVAGSASSSKQKSFFYCASCQLDRPISELSKAFKRHKRCNACVERANAACLELAVRRVFNK